jgi:hypothetical protein
VLWLQTRPRLNPGWHFRRYSPAGHAVAATQAAQAVPTVAVTVKAQQTGAAAVTMCLELGIALCMHRPVLVH